MKFTLKQLRYFDAALRFGSIAKAANEMNISQSSVTAAIDLIEQSVDADLFRRVPAKGIVPTDTGKQVGERVARFLEQARVFEADLMSIAGDPAGILRLGCYQPSAPYVLPLLLSRLSEEYPGIRIDLVEGDIDKMNELLLSGGVDLALTYGGDPESNTSFDVLFQAQPWALLPVNSPLAQKTEVSLHDLVDLPMVMLELATTRSYFFSLFEKHGLQPNVAHSTKSSSVLRGLVANEFGYSILNLCGPHDRDGRNGYCAVPITDADVSPSFGVAYIAALEGATVVQAVRKIASELVTKGAFNHLLLMSEE